MKKISISILLFLLLFQYSLAQSIPKKNDNDKEILFVDEKNILININGRQKKWTILPHLNPDRLNVFCNKDSNSVMFYSKSDTLLFKVSVGDTIHFSIVLNKKDTAFTEIIGIKGLPSKIDPPTKLYYFSRLWSDIKYNFVNIDNLAIDLDSIYKEYIPYIISSKNDYEYYRLLKRFVAILKDGHSEVYIPFYEYTDYIPISIRDYNKRLYITAVKKAPNTDSSWVGAEIINIDGIETKNYMVDSIFPYVSASTEQHLWMQGTNNLQSGLKWNKFRAKIRKSNNEIEVIELDRNGESTRTSEDQFYGTMPRFSRDRVKLNFCNNDSIALLTINRFSPEKEVISQLHRELLNIKKAKGLIIDIRRNGGGSTKVAHYLQSCLTKNPYILNYAWESRINDGVRKANGNWIKEYERYYLNKAYRFERPDTIYVADTVSRIKIPVIILIGRYTFSAAEDFLVNIYEENDRPILIGEETGGSTGSPLVIPNLPSGGYVRICTRRICFPYSLKRFVNQGIKPDIEIEQSLNDFMENKDIVLEKAKEVLNERIKKK